MSDEYGRSKSMDKRLAAQGKPAAPQSDQPCELHRKLNCQWMTCQAAPASQPSVPEPITEMRMCEIPYLILHENQLYRFSVAAGCKECADYLNPPAPADPSSKEVMPSGPDATIRFGLRAVTGGAHPVEQHADSPSQLAGSADCVCEKRGSKLVAC